MANIFEEIWAGLFGKTVPAKKLEEGKWQWMPEMKSEYERLKSTDLFGKDISRTQNLYDILLGKMNSSVIPGADIFKKVAEDETNRLLSRFIGSGIGLTPQFASGIGNIYSDMMSRAVDSWLSRQIDFGKLLAGISSDISGIRTRQYELPLSVLNMAQFQSPIWQQEQYKKGLLGDIASIIAALKS